MKIVSCSRLQAKKFFAALCYANQEIALFERQLVELPEKDWPSVLLASIIIDNSGLVRIRDDLAKICDTPNRQNPLPEPETGKTAFGISNIDDEKRSSDAVEYWVPVPNQYILQNRAWLHPVIRACDPEKKTFTENDYGAKLLDSLSIELGIKLKSQNDTIYVELRHSLEVSCLIIAQPEITGASPEEVHRVMRAALTDEIFNTVKGSALQNYKNGCELRLQGFDDFSRGLFLLVLMIFSFAATGLIFGFYCMSDKERDAMFKMMPS